jgi:pimeloyl-ACP methyl ester carboxylesterase
VTTQHPTVVIDEVCHGLQEVVSPFAPTYLFIRSAGYLSDPSIAADELHIAGLAGLYKPPCILVSPSFAAFTALLFAHRFPDRVAGLVLVDPSHPRQGPAVFEVLSSANVAQSPAIAEFKKFLSGFGPVWDEGCRLVTAEVSSLKDIPLIVLAGGRLEMPSELSSTISEKLMNDRHALLGEYAKLSTRGELRIIPNVGHAIARDAPEVVRAAILDLVNRLKPAFSSE